MPHDEDRISCMIRALAKELETLRRERGRRKIQLVNGKKWSPEGGSGDHHIYRFALEEEVRLQDDTPLAFLVGEGEKIKGFIVSFKDGILTVALEKDLGPTIDSAELQIDDTFLLERLMDRLKEIEEEKIPFQMDSAQRIFAPSPSRIEEKEPDPEVFRRGKTNEEQRRAVRLSLGSQVLFIWGPPGTGKTSTLAQVVEAHYRAGKRILLVSNTNIAVDTAVEKIAERIQTEPGFEEGLLLRIGPVVKEEVLRKFGPNIILDEIVSRLGKDLQEEKEGLEKKSARLQEEIGALQETLELHERVSSLDDRCRTEKRKELKKQEKIQALQKELQLFETKAQALQVKLLQARKAGALKRFLFNLDPERLERRLSQIKEESKSLEKDILAEKEELERARKRLDELTESLSSAKEKVSGRPSRKEAAARLEEVSRLLEKIQKRIQEVMEELRELEGKVRGNCRILATTAYQVYLSTENMREYDTVVVDEASMLMPPLVFFASGMARDTVIVTGDFRQLPPITASRDPLVKEWLKKDIFEKAGIPEDLKAGRVLPYLVSLVEQYRMADPICRMVSMIFYPDHSLRSAQAVEKQDPRFPFPDNPLIYVDTAPLSPWTYLPTGSFSRFNLIHALIARNLVLGLDEAGLLAGEKEPNEAIGVVSPYAAQTRFIHTLLKEKLGNRALGIASTVHRFQGNEKDIMILDLTDSMGAKVSRFLRARKLEEDGARLLNVAASRARNHVILVANFDFLKKNARRSIVEQLLEVFLESGAPLEAKEILPLQEWDYPLPGFPTTAPIPFSPDQVHLFDEKTFYPAFHRDILNAKKSILVFSPFFTERGASRWVEPLRLAIARGVRVHLVTRVPNYITSPVIEELRKIGIRVDIRKGMHEKIATFDNQILWMGSLNIFSHQGTTEQMLRIQNARLCQRTHQELAVPGRGETMGEIQGYRGNPRCPRCGGPTILFQGRKHPLFRCEDFHCNTLSDSHGRIQNLRPSDSSRADTPCPREGCGGKLVLRHGRRGPFLGCSNYPSCKYTEDLR